MEKPTVEELEKRIYGLEEVLKEKDREIKDLHYYKSRFNEVSKLEVQISQLKAAIKNLVGY